MREIKAGSTLTVYTEFLEDNLAVQPTEPASLILVDNTGSIVQQLTTSQQINRPQRWTSDLSIPQAIEPGVYDLVWRLKSKNKQNYTNREQIKIVNGNVPYQEIDILLPEGAPIADSFIATDDVEDDSVSVRIIDYTGTELFSKSDPTAQDVEGQKYYSFSATPTSPLIAQNNPLAVYIIDWKYTVGGYEQHEYHFLYIATPTILMYVNEIKRRIDKAHIQHPNRNLRYNDVDLVAFLNLGLQYINSQPPNQTSYTLANIPQQLYYQVIYAAGIEALSSRYLAEAEAAFNFSGQPIQLEVDRTGFLDSERQFMRSQLENLPTIKKGLVMSGAGSGGVGYSNTMGYANGQGVLSLNGGPTLYLDPNRGNRSAFYRHFLANMGYSSPPEIVTPVA